jgi:integrase
MLLKLTQKGIEAERPDPDARKVLSDVVAPGLQLRIAPDGSKTWSWWGRVREPDGPGRPRRVTIGPLSDTLTLSAARDRARELRAMARAGVDPAAVQRREIEAERQREREELAEAEAVETLGDLLRDWLDWGASRYRPETLKGWTRLARVELAPLAGRPLGEIARRDVRDLLERIGRRSGWTSNRTLEVIRRAFTWAIEQDRVESSPVTGIRKLHSEEASERVLSRDEVRAILRALEPASIADPSDEDGKRMLTPMDPDHADVVRLLWLTGVRRGAVLGMRRPEIESIDKPKAARWTIPGGLHGRAKNRKALAVPLVPQAVAIIRGRLERPGDLLFRAHGDGSPRGRGSEPLSGSEPPRPLSWASHEVARLKARADAILGAPAPRWRVHDIRHTIATLMREELRVSREVVSAVLGHTEGPAATRVYDRSELLDERRAALVAWAAWLDGLRTERKGAKVVPMSRRGRRRNT